MFLTSVPLITLSTVYWDYLVFHLHRSLTNHFSFHLLTSCSDKNLLINSLHFSCKIQTYMLGLRKPGDTLSLGSFHDFTRFLSCSFYVWLSQACFLSLSVLFSSQSLLCSIMSVLVFIIQGEGGRCVAHTLLFLFCGSVCWEIHEQRNYAYQRTYSAYRGRLSTFSLN